ISIEQIIGEFNYQKQLLTIELVKSNLLEDEDVQKTIFSEDFFIKRPLLEAFSSKEDVVLLIDEIDKSDAEFESFLLEALGERQITIPELKTFHCQNDILVIMTSNAERMLSEPLKRRCLHLYMDFPTKEREMEIVKIHAPDVPELLLQQALHVIHELRRMDLRKLPSISESFEWLRSLLSLNIEKLDRPTIRSTLNVILKYQEDIKRVNSKLHEILISIPSEENLK
ncbi:MAG: AAA family ATPase, partial [Candidatus Helarchaeales archaeon]